MKVAIITPTIFLKKYSSLGTCDMMLAHEWVKNKEYLEYFKERKKKGNFVLMDNWAFEGERIIWKELVELTEKTMPSCVIMPDILWNYEETKKDTLDFYQEYGQEVLDLGVDLMAVPQGETFEKFLKNYKLFTSLKGVNYIWVSYTIFFKDIPWYEKELEELERNATETEVKMLRRYFLFKYMEENNLIDYTKKHHLLWLANPYEYKLYNNLKNPTFIYSGDSALAYIMGKQKRLIDIERGVIGEREKSLEDFNEKPKLDKTQVLTIIRNIQVIKKFAENIKKR